MFDWFGLVCFAIKTKLVSSHTADSKPVKQEVNSTAMLPPLVFPPEPLTRWVFYHCATAADHELKNLDFLHHFLKPKLLGVRCRRHHIFDHGNLRLLNHPWGCPIKLLTTPLRSKLECFSLSVILISHTGLHSNDMLLALSANIRPRWK